MAPRPSFDVHASTLLLNAPALAQTDKSLRVLVGFPAGVSIDVVSRILTDKMKEERRRPVIVDNRPGAGGRLAADGLLPDDERQQPTNKTLLQDPCKEACQFIEAIQWQHMRYVLVWAHHDDAALVTINTTHFENIACTFVVRTKDLFMVLQP